MESISCPQAGMISHFGYVFGVMDMITSKYDGQISSIPLKIAPYPNGLVSGPRNREKLLLTLRVAMHPISNILRKAYFKRDKKMVNFVLKWRNMFSFCLVSLSAHGRCERCSKVNCDCFIAQNLDAPDRSGKGHYLCGSAKGYDIFNDLVGDN